MGVHVRPGGKRASDPPSTTFGWSTQQLANHLGMSRQFVILEINARAIIASRFGREYRIASSEVRRYCEARGYPVPESLVRV